MIQAEHLCKNFASVTALADISFSVSEGELFGFIGPDGAGKTTLFRLLATLMRPDSGAATLSGYDVVKDYKQLRLITGYMPGRFSLYHDLTVEENLRFHAAVFGATVEENYELIKDIYSHIEPFKKRLAGRLSGGMKQKLALSCALIHAPTVLLLDEPTTGVDAVSRMEFWQMLKNLQSHGITILVSTPYMDEAGLCDRVALLQDGQILSIDSPARIVARFDKKLWAVQSDDKHMLIERLRSYRPIESVFAFGDSVHITTVNDELDETELVHFLTAQTEEIHITTIKPNIEDCFLRLMRKN
ncbi:ABC transporter ATP-binding protein [candidate division KSB1 bacterium]|nr:ABC transporter ATP-binding protein [candidate division KSB1 bacterium]